MKYRANLNGTQFGGNTKYAMALSAAVALGIAFIDRVDREDLKEFGKKMMVKIHEMKGGNSNGNQGQA